MKSASQSLRQRILHGSSIVIVFSLLAAPFGYFIRMLYSRTLSIETFGLFYAVFAFVNFFTSYNDLGFGVSLAYYTPKFIKKSDFLNVWNSYKYSQIVSFLISIFVSVIIFLTADWLSVNYFKNPYAKNVLLIFIFFLLANGFVSITSNFFVGLQKEIYYSSKEFIRLFFTLLFSILVWFFDSVSVIYYAWTWSLAYVLTAMFFFYFLYKKNVHLVRGFKWNKKLFDKLLKYALPSVLVTSIYTFITSTDVFFLTLFRGLRDVGIYNIVLPIVSIPTILLIPLSSLFLPLSSHLMEENKEKVLKLINHILIYIPFIVYYFVLFVVLFPKSSIGFLFGNRWIVFAEKPLVLLSIGTIFANLSYYLSILAAGMGFAKERLRISLIVAVLNILIGATLIYKFGIMGAVIAYGLIYIISLFFYGSLVKSTVSFSYPVYFYFKLILFGFLLYLVTQRFPIIIRTWPIFILVGILYTVLMGGLALTLKLFDKNMLQLLTRKEN